MPEFKKMPKKGVKNMPVYSKTSGLDTTKKGNKEKDANYTVNSSRTDEYWQEAEKKDIKRPNVENMPKGSVFTMKYQGNTSAFPFKSAPTKNYKKGYYGA